MKKNFCGIKYNIIQKSSARGRKLIFVPGIMLSKIKNIINIVIKENAMENKLTHFDENGNAVMIDVSDKPVTHRTAIAPLCKRAILRHQTQKADSISCM